MRVRHYRSRKQRWIHRVRVRIVANFRDYPAISIIIAALLIPGGFVLVPVIAWWHRRKRAAMRPLQGKRAPERRKMVSHRR